MSTKDYFGHHHHHRGIQLMRSSPKCDEVTTNFSASSLQMRFLLPQLRGSVGFVDECFIAWSPSTTLFDENKNQFRLNKTLIQNCHVSQEKFQAPKTKGVSITLLKFGGKQISCVKKDQTGFKQRTSLIEKQWSSCSSYLGRKVI